MRSDPSRLAGMVLLVGFFAVRTDWGVVAAALTAPRAPAWLAAALGAYAVGQVGNGLAWRGLLATTGVLVPFGAMIRHDLSSVFWSTVLPGGVAGELVKGARLARTVDLGAVTVSLLTARLVGGTMACLLALAALPWSGIAGLPRAVGLVALLGTTAVGLGGLAVVRIGPSALARVPWLAARVPLGPFPPVPAVLAAAALTLATHVSFAAVYSLCFAAAGHPVSLADGAVICALTSVAQLAPVTVGGFGVRELTIAGLGATLVPAPAAAAAAVALTATFTVVVALGGLVELGRLRPVPT